jgi:hypothetical protein
MTESEWDGCTDANTMLAFLHGKASIRRFQLFVCASVRLWGACNERTIRWVESQERGNPEGKPETLEIRASFPGTFYARPRPGAPPYVTPGSLVAPDSVVGLLESMKVYDDLPAECSGIVVETLVNNGEVARFRASCDVGIGFRC